MSDGDVILKVPVPAGPSPSFLVLDTESVPDGRLLLKTKYAEESLTPEEAISRAKAEARDRSPQGSDFVPVTYQIPVAVCVIRVANDFSLQALACLDAPSFRTAEMVRKFWQGLARYPKAKLVTFNGRGFDLPLLELAGFRYGCQARDYFQAVRNRFQGNHIDLCDWFSNYGASRVNGGLDLFAKLLGKPGKMEVSGDQVYSLYQAGKLQEINDYCLFDTLDTYFVFLRTRLMIGEFALEQEQDLVRRARAFLTEKVSEFPALQQYLDHWGDWQPWP